MLQNRSYLGPKIWILVPTEIKNFETLEISRKKIKSGSQIDAHVGKTFYRKPRFC